MYIPVLILILFIALILILIVMVQNPKGGGLSSTFGGGANTIGGVQNTNTFLDKATWFLAISLFTLILLSNFLIDRTGEKTLDKTTTTAPVSSTPVEPKKEENK